MSANPILVEVMRGERIESRHRGAFAVVDGNGSLVASAGDIEFPIFPRSAIKAIQALPLIETGTADALGLDDAALSLACSSHSGEVAHIEKAGQMLAAAGLGESALECGGHWSFVPKVMLDQSQRYDDTPGPICNNCSGKHSGFLCTAAHVGEETSGYIKPSHPAQMRVRDAMQAVTGAIHADDHCGTDGCSIPTYAIPLKNLAAGFARMTTGNGLGAERARAAQRLLNACMNNAFYMAGTNRFCTRIMDIAPGEIFAKTGAEGVFCAALPSLGFGIALKCDDGATRASEVMMAALVSSLLPSESELQPALHEMANPELRNWNNLPVGGLKSTLPAN